MLKRTKGDEQNFKSKSCLIDNEIDFFLKKTN